MSILSFVIFILTLAFGVETGNAQGKNKKAHSKKETRFPRFASTKKLKEFPIFIDGVGKSTAFFVRVPKGFQLAPGSYLVSTQHSTVPKMESSEVIENGTSYVDFSSKAMRIELVSGDDEVHIFEPGVAIFHPKTDLALFPIEKTPRVFAENEISVQPSHRVSVRGYPSDSYEEDHTLRSAPGIEAMLSPNGTRVAYMIDPKSHTDRFTEIVDDPKLATLPTRLADYSGLSGAPVRDSKGAVIGVLGSGMVTENYDKKNPPEVIYPNYMEASLFLPVLSSPYMITLE